MFIYYVIFFSLAVLCLLEHSNRQRPWSLILSFYTLAILSAYAGLRSAQTGQDYDSYRAIFESFSGLTEVGFGEVLSFNYFFEPGFAFYIALFKSFSYSHELFFFVTAVINCAIFYRVSSKLTPLLLTTWLVYFSYLFFTHGLVAIRFGIASALGLYVVYWLTFGQRIKAFAFATLALLFHTSALALFLAIISSFIKANRFYLLLLLLLSFVIGMFSLGGAVISNMLPSWLPRADSALRYITSGQYGESLGFLGFVNVKNMLLSLLVIIFWHRGNEKYQHYYYLSVFLLLGTCLRLAFHDLGFIIGRLSSVLTFTEVFLFPMIMFLIFKNKIFSLIFIFLYALVNLAMMLHIRGFGEYNSVLFI